MMKQRNADDPLLLPIEDPKDPNLKQIYAMQEQYLGKVLTPSKVHSARLPPSFAQFYGKVSELDKELKLSPETVALIRTRVAQINVCEFCMDANRAGIILASMNQAKFDALDEYKTSSIFTDGERAMLDYATELTKNKKVSQDTFDRMAKYYSEREICEIVYIVASEHLYNITNIGLNIHSDMICDIAKKRKYA
jgi:alkylhydroperoxidase family enzyme